MTYQLKTYITSMIQPAEAEWKKFEEQLKVKELKAGEMVFSEGQTCSHLIFINKGCMRLYYIKEGEEVNTYFAFENKLMFNYESFLKKQPMKYYIQALEDTEAVFIPRDVFFNSTNEFYSWNNLGRILTEQSYLHLVKRVESFLFMTAEERYLDLMKNYPTIFERIALLHIASYLGIAAPSLSRIRHNLVKKS